MTRTTITTPTDEHLPATIAETPFNDKATDLILRSEDSVNFYVYRIVLSLASPFFTDMFSLPQTYATTAHSSAPTVDCTESSQTLDHLLRLCYPVTDPVIKELNEVADVLEAAMKYQMEEATAMMMKLLLTFINTKPLQVFAIACRLQLTTEAEVAAKKWREICPQNSGIVQGELHAWNVTSAGASFVPEIASISAGCHFRLLRFIRTGTTTTFLEPEASLTAEPTMEATITIQHPFVFENADIILRSADGVDFHVHSVIISLASANLIDNITPSQDVIPVVALPEEGRIITKLLKLCYPMGISDLGDLNAAYPVLQAAIKYKMTGVIELAKKQWMEHLKTNPVRVYFTAVQNGWNEEMQEAARCAANQTIEDVYVPEMEFMSATVYHRLLEYRHKYRSTVAAITSDHEKTSYESWTADMSTWWDGSFSNEGDQAPVPMLIAAPIVQRELRALATKPRNNHMYSRHDYYYTPEPTVPNIRTLIDENIALATKLQEALSKIELELELPHVFPLSRDERQYS